MFNKKEYDKKYYQEHKEERIQHQKEYMLDKKEQKKEYDKQYHLYNKEIIKQKKKLSYQVRKKRGHYKEKQKYINQYQNQWRKNNPGKTALSEIKNRTNRRYRVPKWLSKKELKEIELFYDNRPEGYVVDHIIPLQGKEVSGLHRIGNLQYLTIKENAEKYNSYN